MFTYIDTANKKWLEFFLNFFKFHTIEDLEEADYLKVQKIVREVGLCEIKEKLKNEIEIFEISFITG